MTPEARKRLAAQVRARRRELGLSIVDAAKAADVSRMTWDALEKATRDTRDANYARIERALGWRRGSVERVLDGGQPLPHNGNNNGNNGDHYLDPATGEVYTDPDERALWALTHLPQDTRRGLITYLRGSRGHSDRQRRTG